MFGKKILYIYLLFLIKTLFLFYNNNKYFIGQDQLLIVDPEYEYINYPMVKFTLEYSHSNLYEYIIKKLYSIIDDPKSSFRRIQISNKKYKYSKEDVEKIISYSFENVESIKNVAKMNIVNKASKNLNKQLIVIGNDGFIICQSHLLHSSYSSLNIIKNICDTEYIELKNFIYIPIYNEINSINNLKKTFFYLNKTIFTKQYLKLDYPQKENHKHYLIKQKIPIDIIKKTKNEIEKKINRKISFNIVYISSQLLQLFNSIKKDKISIGITIGFNNKSRINIFSLICLEINRPSNFDKIKDDIDIFLIEMSITLQKKIDAGNFLIPLFYSLTNIYNISIKLNNCIDVLFSSCPLTIKKDFMIDNIKITDMSGTMPYHTAPIYIYYLSTNEYIFVTNHIRTEDVDRDNLKKFGKLYLNDQRN